MERKLSVFEASCIITGYGVGSGILAMPSIAQKCGMPLTIVILISAFVFSYLLHLMVADVAIKKGETGDVIGIVGNALPENAKRKPITVGLFFVLSVILYSNLAIYICGAADIICNIFGGKLWIYKLFFYAFASVIGVFGIKILGISEKYAIIAIILLEGSLLTGSFFDIKNVLPFGVENLQSVIAFFSVAMFGFVAFFSVPQVVIGLDKDEKKIKKAVFFGMLVNLCLMITVIVSSLLASDDVTEVSIIGLSNGIGLWAKIIGSAFTVLVMLSSYWAIAVSLKDIVVQNTKLGKAPAFIVASVPSLLISFIPSSSFLTFLEITSGGMALLVILFLIPLYHVSRKDGQSVFGKFPHVLVEILVLLGCILMAVGSFL